MKRFDVAVLTTTEYLRGDQNDWYIAQLTREDQLLIDALESLDLSVQRLAWDDPAMDWSTTRVAVIRSCWDYFQRFGTFSSWLQRVASQTMLINPRELILWNSDKHYLTELEARGVAIVPTRIIEAGQAVALVSLCRDTGWNEIVIKPAVSASANLTYRIPFAECDQYQSRFEQMLQSGAVLVQPFQHSIQQHGELSLILLGGQYSHAIRKLPKAGDFRVQDDHGGSVHDYQPSREEIAFAEQALHSVPFPADYARVDLVRDQQGQVLLMEMEMIEPELFFRLKEGSALLLAKAVASRLRNLAGSR